MNNHINRQHIALVLNVKCGWNRPKKYAERFNVVNTRQLKLRFGTLQITFTKAMNIAAVKAA